MKAHNFLQFWRLTWGILILLLTVPAGAATLTVTNLADNGPGALRQRIAAASCCAACLSLHSSGRHS